MPLTKFRLSTYIYTIYHFLETILLIKICTETIYVNFYYLLQVLFLIR